LRVPEVVEVVREALAEGAAEFVYFNTGYFDTFRNYWDINHYQAALEIAKSVDDDQLLRLARENPPKYALNLGGFQGNWYTATENGLVSLESSWLKVRENVKHALGRWQMGAFGALQSLLNLGGETTYWKLLEEAEKLGARISPYLLKRLEAMRLLFKTGSNRYPTWTIPPEIIPPLKEELDAFSEIKLRIQSSGSQSKSKTAILIQAGQPYTALREVEEILRQAKEYVKIVDPWLGEEALDLFWKLPLTVHVQVLTRTVVKPDRFRSAYYRLIQEKRGHIEIRQSDSRELHDRFVITENSAWSLGPSLKDLGKKLGTITKISDEKVMDQMETFFDRIWGSAPRLWLG
jgi:hypothetical protein